MLYDYDLVLSFYVFLLPGLSLTFICFFIDDDDDDDDASTHTHTHTHSNMQADMHTDIHTYQKKKG